MSPLPETLVHYRTDLEEAIGREQAARLRQGRRRQRHVALRPAAARLRVSRALRRLALVTEKED